MPKVAVVYLIRIGNEPIQLERFIASYRRYDSGLPHTLVFVLKGLDGSFLSNASQLLEGIPYTFISISDEGVDITAYAKCAVDQDESVTHLMFLNSHSEILADGWLKKMHAPFLDPKIGMTGATGSWQSNFNGIFHGVLRFFKLVKCCFQKNERDGAHEKIRAMLLDAPREQSSIRYQLQNPFYFYRHFRRFPNPHLRTTGFMIRRDVFISTTKKPIKTKRSAYVFESGRSGLPKKLKLMGLRQVVVDRHGHVYEIGEWLESKTFWADDQINLMIGDNQTRRYDSGSSKERVALEMSAWRRGSVKSQRKAEALLRSRN